jgi:carbonic anhydrase/acetyltransferase-like protein (isoleucine patch superfamily)
MAEVRLDVKVHETSYVHPSALLEGNVDVGAWSRIEAGVVVVGDVTIGEHVTIYPNCVLRGTIEVGDYSQIYDCVCIEGGRGGPFRKWMASDQDEKTVLGEGAWVNHGASLHGAEVGAYAAIGLNASLNYGCRIGDDAVVTDGSACPLDMVVPANCVAEGVPAEIVRRDISDRDRIEILGLTVREGVPMMVADSDEFIRSAKAFS